MSSIQLELPDGSIQEHPVGTTSRQIAEGIGPRLAARSLAAVLNGKPTDLDRPLEQGGTFQLLTFDSLEGKAVYWHSTSHLMAQAVKQLYPEAKLTIGPAIEAGFYYDFDTPQPIREEELAEIEARMKELAEQKLAIQREEVSREEALELFERAGETYKVEMLEDIEGDRVSLYRQGDFVDLCRGPHVANTGQLGSFKVLSVAGAYWRGDEKRKMLQRLYGISFPTSKELRQHLEWLEEAEKRDHRRLGRELKLFSHEDQIGPGLTLWHPNGGIVRRCIEDFWREEHERRGYQLVFTPHIARADLWRVSGHLENYAENMYSAIDIDGQEYILKPMNCPFHILIYKSETRSYRDLPIRYSELGTVYRYERSGVLHGLLRVRGFTQDDAHIFCTPDQLRDEIAGVIDFADYMLRQFGFKEYRLELATRPEKYAGSDEMWETATNSLREVLEEKNLPYDVDEGGGVFYGPKIDIKIKDSLGRYWQGPTTQFDFNLPERFDVNYIGSDGAQHKVYMVHRTVLGSMERFMGNLIEHYGGAFPTWLAPVQVVMVPIADRHSDRCAEIAGLLRAQGARVEIDHESAKTSVKIAEAEARKVPYMAVVGDRELENGTLSVRGRGRRDLGSLSVEAFADRVTAEIKSRTEG